MQIRNQNLNNHNLRTRSLPIVRKFKSVSLAPHFKISQIRTNATLEVSERNSCKMISSNCRRRARGPEGHVVTDKGKNYALFIMMKPLCANGTLANILRTRLMILDAFEDNFDDVSYQIYVMVSLRVLRIEDQTFV